MSLVDQIFEQAKLGTAADPSANPFATGVQLGQSQQRIDQAKQQLAMEIAQAPLKQTLLQQHARLNEFQLTKALNLQNADVEAQGAIAEFSGLAGAAFRNGQPEEAMAGWLDVLHKHPGASNDPEFMKFPQLISTSVNSKLELQKLKANDFAGPELKTITDPTNPDGAPVTFGREGPNSWKPITDTTVEVKTPDGTVVRQTTGRGGAATNGLQGGVAGDVEKRLAANTRSLALLNESIPLVTPTTVGPVGALSEGLETARNIVSPGSSGTESTAARQTLRITRQQLYNSLKADSQINAREGKAMEEIADVTRLNESAPGAIRKLGILRDLTALQSVLLNHQLNKFAPDDALKAMSVEQVARAWKRGDMTDAEAKRWNEIHQAVTK